MTAPNTIFSVAAILPLVQRHYANPGGGAGCCLHLVLDDGNIGDDHVIYCVKMAKHKGHKDCESLARIIFCMSKTQRNKLSVNRVPRPATVIPVTVNLDHIIPDLGGELGRLRGRASALDRHPHEQPRYFKLGLAGKSEQDILEWFAEAWEATPAELDGFSAIAGSWIHDDYDEDAWILLRRARGALFEVRGSHCSCYGFEGQFRPEVTTLQYLLSDHFHARAIDTNDFQSWLRQQEWLRL
jgi:hypothetical protein